MLMQLVCPKTDLVTFYHRVQLVPPPYFLRRDRLRDVISNPTLFHNINTCNNII